MINQLNIKISCFVFKLPIKSIILIATGKPWIIKYSSFAYIPSQKNQINEANLCLEVHYYMNFLRHKRKSDAYDKLL